MHTAENSTDHTQSSNTGWQNIGISYMYAEDKIEHKYRATFMAIIRYSFGYKDRSTGRHTQVEWSKKIGLSERTFRTHIKWLTDSGHIQINTSSDFVSGGGSKAFSYSPVFPRGYGAIKFKNTEQNVEEANQQSRQAEARTENNKMEW